MKSVKKIDGIWQVTYEQDGQTKTIQAPRLAICAGLHNKKKPIGAPISNFTGTTIHAGDIKEITPSDFGANDRVLVYGGGETASDIIDLLVKTPARITWAIRGGQHFLRKTPYHQRKGVGLFDKHDFALDLIASPLINAVSPFSKGAPGRRYITDFLSTGSFGGYQGHGVHQWRNEHRYAQQFFNKNGHTVEYVKTGRVSPQNDVIGVQENTVQFASGDSDRFTHIICCFGYEFHCPFLPLPYSQGKLDSFYQFVFPPDDPSIGFLGFARPIIGSIPLMTEMQCLWAFRVWSGKVDLPSEEKMRTHQSRINKRWDERLPGRGNLRTLVLPSTYVAMMLKAAFPGRSPGEHFKKHPIRGLRFLTWIPSASIRLALDPAISNQEFNILWRKRRHGFLLGWMLPMLIVISRFLRLETLVDWYIGRMENRRLGEAITTRKNRVAKTSSNPSIDHRRAA